MLMNRQFEAHLKGKKHIKAAKDLRKAMREEDFALGVSDGVSTAGTATPNIHKNRDSFDIDPDVTEELEEERNFVDLDETALEKEETLEHEKTHPAEKTAIEQEEGLKNSISNTAATSTPPESKPQTTATDENSASDTDSEVSLERDLDALFLGKKDHPQPPSQDQKPKIGAAKAKRQKKAEKLAALEAEGKIPPKRKARQVYDPVAAMQKARGETVTTGRKGKKK
jgi:DnaJ homolog subfamily A member 5